MLQTRVIPVLLLRNKGLVKTLRFKESKYVGDPLNAIRIFNDKEVDELIFLDIDASKEGRDPDYELIESFASECFMPVCYGGGIQTIEQIRKIFSLGIEKVAINAAALRDMTLIAEAVALFGAQSIVIAIDVKKSILGKCHIYDHVAKKSHKQGLAEYIDALNNIGVGELFINSVDLDGTQNGYDLGLLGSVTAQTNIPVIACGGAGSLGDFKNAKNSAGVSAVAAGSFFVFQGKHRAVLITYPKYHELETLFNEV